MIVLGSFTKAVEKQQETDFTYQLQVVSLVGGAQLFDIAIKSEPTNGENDVVVRQYYGIETTYALDLEPGKYTILIKSHNGEYAIESRLMKIKHGQVVASASSTKSVAILETVESSGVSSWGL